MAQSPLIYADYNATTPVVAPVQAALTQFYTDVGNMSSAHWFGQVVARHYAEASEAIRQALGAESFHYFSCSGATEATNWLVHSLCSNRRDCPRVIISSIEHPCVWEPLRWYDTQGMIDLQVCPVDSMGVLRMASLEALLTPNTALVSVMLANNEVGIIQPIQAIAAMAKRVGACVHSDVVQGAGKIPIHANAWGLDAITVSAHKCYAPTGYGALIIRDDSVLKPMVRGGAQQQRLRGGTVHVSGTVSLAAGLAYCANQPTAWSSIPDALAQACQAREDIVVVGSPSDQHLPNTVSLAITNRSAESMVMQLDMMGIASAAGSACSTGAIDPSSVVQALGYPPSVAESTLRFSFGIPTTAADIVHVFNQISQL